MLIAEARLHGYSLKMTDSFAVEVPQYRTVEVPLRCNCEKFEFSGGKLFKYNFLGNKCLFCCPANINIPRKGYIVDFHREQKLNGVVLGILLNTVD